MGSKRLLLVTGIFVIACGCDSGIRAKAPAVPAAPAPLILAQTTVELPSPQPVPPESVPPRPSVDAPLAETAEPVIQIPRRVPAPVRTRPQEPVRVAAPAPQTPAVEVGTGPLLSGEDLAKSNARVQGRLTDLRNRLRPFANNANAGTKAAASRIESFLRLADEEVKRGDLRQADAMADRAETLLKEIARK